MQAKKTHNSGSTGHRPHRRLVSLAIAATLAATLFATAVPIAGAAKPTPIPPLPGRIYYTGNNATWSMKADGSDKRPEAQLLAAYRIKSPSFRAYGSDRHRWWLAYKDIGVSLERRELFAYAIVGGSVVECQLTNVGLGVRENEYVRLGAASADCPTWSNDGLDSFVSFAAMRYFWDPIAGKYTADRVELCRLLISAAEIELLAEQGQSLLAPIEQLSPCLTTSVFHVTQYARHHCSPDANTVLYDYRPTLEDSIGLWGTNLTTLETIQLAGYVGDFHYSPNPLVNRLVVHQSGSFWTMNPDGTAPYLVLSSHPRGFYIIVHPVWSPDSQYFAFTLLPWKQNTGGYNLGHVCRVPASGGTYTVLTNDVGPFPGCGTIAWLPSE